MKRIKGVFVHNIFNRIEKTRNDNRGASIIMVVIACVFVMALGSIIISSALRNIEMKATDRKSKKNFYSAEAALEEIKIYLGEIVSDNLAKSYHSILTKYSTTNEVSRKSLFETTFIDEMKISLQVQIDIVSMENVVPKLLLNGFLAETKMVSGNGAEVTTSPKWRIIPEDSIILEGLVVKYQDEQYVTTLGTDIKIMFPDVTFGVSTGITEQLPFQHYALIADKHLLVNASTHAIRGSVYAGLDGIEVMNPDKMLSIYDGTVISAGNITVKDKGSFLLDGLSSELWARNLITTQSNKAEEQVSQTTLRVNGRSFVQDDLILDAKKSAVTFLGEYYGFSSGIGPENNSAIMINASNATLDLSNLSKLTLAGRAFVNLNNLTDLGIGGTNSNIQTGESLAIKGSQNAYLLPEEYIAVGHNPVTWSEYRHYNTIGETLVDIPMDAKIFQHSLISEEESKLLHYLNPTDPVKLAFYKFDRALVSEDGNVVYYYLNFKDDSSATNYFKNFRLCYPDKIYNGFPVNQIKINNTAGAVVSAGNLTTFEGGSLGMMVGNNGIYLNNYIIEYENLCQTLQKNVGGIGGVFHNLIHVGNLTTDGATNGGIAYEIYSGDPTKYMVLVKNGDFILDASNQFGLIIATGDVVVNQSFRGLIISGKQISLYGGANLQADNNLILQIIEEHPDLHRYIQELSSRTEASRSWNAIDISELIVYEKWSKN